jgi:aminoglycoside phosphotransferase (APT) family kinase protein
MIESDVAIQLLDVLARQCGREITYAESPVPLAGGFSNDIFRFRLNDPPTALGGPLVLRLTHDDDDTAREAIIQDGVARSGYPAPGVACYGSAEELGRPFIVTRLEPGVTFADALRPGTAVALFRNISTRIAVAMSELHDVPTNEILQRLSVVGWDADRLGGLGVVAEVAALARDLGDTGLRRGVRWLDAHAPRPPAAPVVCHGDFHVMNLLYDNGRIASVLDWELARVADPVFDVARTAMLLRMAPLPMAKVARPVVQLVRRRLAGSFVAAYRVRRPFDHESLQWHEALHALRTLTIALAGARPNAPPRLRRTSEVWLKVAALLRTRFRELTGVDVIGP